MTESEQERGVLIALIERFEQSVLPRALDIKAKVDGGAPLADYDIAFLENVLQQSAKAHDLIDRHPDLQDLYTRAVSLYHDIVRQAAANEPAP